MNVNRFTRSKIIRHTRTTLIGLGLAVLGISLSGCGNSLTAIPDPLDHARLVPKVAGQAISLLQASQRGVRTRADMHIGSLLTEDFHGRPFTYVNFTTAFPVEDPLALTPDQISSSDPATMTVITGASTGRTVAYALSHDLSLLSQLQNTLTKFGGRQNLKRIISLQGGFDLFLESKNGEVWIVGDTPTLASAEQVQKWTSQENEARTTLSKETKLYDSVEKAWDEMLDPQSTKTRGASLNMGDFMRSDGNLNLSKAVTVTQARGVNTGTLVNAAHPTTRVVTGTGAECWWFLWWQVCDATTYGALSNSKVPGGGYGQYASDYGISSDWNVNGYKLLSCGTEGFVTLAWWWWRYRNANFYNMASRNDPPMYYRVFDPNNPNAVIYEGNTSLPITQKDYSTGIDKVVGYYKKWSQDSFAQRMVKLDANRSPEIAAYTLPYPVYFFSTTALGEATNPWDVQGGGERWLANQKANYSLNPGSSSLVMRSRWITPLVNAIPLYGAYTLYDYSYSIGSIINEHVGARDNMVLALYPTQADALSGPHYSAILKYRIVWGAVQQAWITPVDDPSIFQHSGSFFFPTTPMVNHEYNMATIEGLAKGVFYFEKTQ